jgi:hypothetical protein
MSTEHLVELKLVGETEVLGENFTQCHFVQDKSYMTGYNPGPRQWEVGN